MRGRWPVIEDMAQVRIALPAPDFDAPHSVGAVGFRLDVFVRDRRPETRPSGAGLELRIGTEQRTATADTAIEAFLMQIVVFARKGELCVGTPGNGVLRRR